MSARFAAQIMLIRHGEKRPGDPPPHDVSAHGERDTESLTVRGWQRAGALASLFAPATGKDARHGLSVPRHVFACNSHKHSNARVRRSRRWPGSSGLKSNEDFSAGDEAELARHARARHAAVSICWRHHHLHTLAHHIVGDRTTIPQNWNEDRYDLVWVFDLDPATGNYVFREVTQELLDGDL